MCPCGLFPVYADKVEGIPKLPPELNTFCLYCIFTEVLGFGGPLVKACNIWAPGFIQEMEAHYITFYEEKEFNEIKSLKTPMTELEKVEQAIMKEEKQRRWMGLLERMGFAER
jgi:hypothetical protein